MPQELEDAFGRGWDYLHLMFADAVSASRIIEEWGREGKEIRGPEGHKQRDWLTRFKTRSLNAVAGWTQTDCSHDRDLLEPLVPALANVLPDGEAAQEDSERPDRPNVGLMTRNAGPNRCFLWEQDQHYLPLGSHDLYVCWVRVVLLRDSFAKFIRTRHRPKRSSGRVTTCATAS